MYRRFTIALLGGLLICATAHAKPQGNCGSNCVECHALSTDEARSILKELGEVKSVRISPVKGLWEITLERDGRQAVAYMDFARKNIIAGKIFPLTTGELGAQGAAEHAPATANPAVINTASIPIGSSIVMGNPKGTRKLFVFTDPDCPYCRKMHEELAKLEKIDPEVAIYVFLNPRPDSYEKSRAILAGESRALLDKAFSGKEILNRPDSPEGSRKLEEIVHFARRNGITATPSMVLDDGAVLTGFRDAESMKKLLTEKPATAVAPK